MVAETQKFLKSLQKIALGTGSLSIAMGFNAYYFLKQPGEAGKLFLEAAKTPNAPSYLTILGARLAQKGGETATAIVIMNSILANKNPEEPGYSHMADRLHALEGVLVIEQAVKRFAESRGRKPLSLHELTDSELLKTLPANPYNEDYCIDQAGIIYFDKPDCNILAPGSNYSRINGGQTMIKN